MVGMLIVLMLLVGIGFTLRHLGQREDPRISAVQPPNTTAIIIKATNTVSHDKDGIITGVKNDGGDIVDVIHTVPGCVLDKTDDNPMNWFIKEGTEVRNLWYRTFGFQFIGLINRLRISEIRTFRWGRKVNEEKYRVMSKTSFTRYAHFSGQHDVEMSGVETAKVLKFNLRFNFTVEETFPVRARLLTADTYATFTMLVMDHVNTWIGAVDPKEFIEGTPDVRGQRKENLKEKLISSFDKIHGTILTETGLSIRKANLPDLDFDEATKTVLEAETTAQLQREKLKIDAEGTKERAILAAEGEKQSAILAAEGASRAQLLRNDADADRVTRVLLPMTEDDRKAAVFTSDREAAAYEANKTVTTFAPGHQKVVTLGQ